MDLTLLRFCENMLAMPQDDDADISSTYEYLVWYQKSYGILRPITSSFLQTTKGIRFDIPDVPLEAICALILIAQYIWEGSWPSAHALLLWYEETYGILDSLTASFLLTKTGSDFSKPYVPQFLLSRGARMTPYFVENVLPSTIVWKERFSRCFARLLGAHFVAEQKESAITLFTRGTGLPISHQVKYPWHKMPPFAPMPSDIVDDHVPFCADPTLCAYADVLDTFEKYLNDTLVSRINGDVEAEVEVEYEARRILREFLPPRLCWTVGDFA